MADDFEGLNQGDAYQSRAAQETGQDVTVFQPRFPYAAEITEKFPAVKDAESWQTLIDSIFPSAKTLTAVRMALTYCRDRKLDIFKRPVHIVPMWHAALRREVETVWIAISELRITAFRTEQYAGMDAPEFGPVITSEFTGDVRGKDGRYHQQTIPVRHPEWCRITVYRLVGGQRCAFVGPYVTWKGAYATIGRSDLPNTMWQERPLEQLEKCAEAAALRRAFPEQMGGELTSDEMAGRAIAGDADSRKFVAPPVEGINVLSAKEIEPRPNGQDRPEQAITSEEREEPEVTHDHWAWRIAWKPGDRWAKAAAALRKSGLSEEQVRAMSDAELLRLEGLGAGSLGHIRNVFPRPKKKSPASPPPAPPPPPPVAQPQTLPPQPVRELAPEPVRSISKTPEDRKEPEDEFGLELEQEAKPPSLIDRFREVMSDVAMRAKDVAEYKTAAEQFRGAVNDMRQSKVQADLDMVNAMNGLFKQLWQDRLDRDQKAAQAPQGSTETAKPNAPATPTPETRETRPEPQEAQETATDYAWPEELEKQIAGAGSGETLRYFCRQIWGAQSPDQLNQIVNDMEATPEYGRTSAPERIALATARAKAFTRLTRS